jgi:cyclic beta-1,2-glucan synthetase
MTHVSPENTVEDDDLPRHVKVLSIEELEAHARAIASTPERPLNTRNVKPLLPRLNRSAARLVEAYRILAIAALGRQALPSEELFCDSFHVVSDQIRKTRDDLPLHSGINLPGLESGTFEGYPRTYVIARELIGHTAGKVDLESLTRYVRAYQMTAPLLIGEIWAIQIMLQLGLVENLRRLIDEVIDARKQRERVTHLSGALERAFEWTTSDIERVIGGDSPRLTTSFVVELLQWLRDRPSSAVVWSWLSLRLEREGTSAEEMIRLEQQREADGHVAIGNVLASMRVLSSLDWSSFFEQVDAVEGVLKDDPAGAYSRMDFETRNRYRQAVQLLSKRSGHKEVFVARWAIELARAAQVQDPSFDRRHHVGYYFVSRGRFVLEQRLGYRPRIHERLSRFAVFHPALSYVSSISLAVSAVMGLLLAYASRQGATTGDVLLLALLSVIPVSELVIRLVNRLRTFVVSPRPLPRLEVRDGLPSGDRTIVAVPVILSSEKETRELISRLEVQFLANRDPSVHFALLGDLPDAPAETTHDDRDLVAAAAAGIERLNTTHGPDRFFFLHRARGSNPAERRWTGGRGTLGMLHEFNRLLRGARDTSFTVRVGNSDELRSTRYVITLEPGTELPMNAARRIVGILSHPLNRPRFDPRLGRVTEGYGILQPRIRPSVESVNRTFFAKVFAEAVDLDISAAVGRDIHQDLFSEARFTGNGIYDVDAFEASLADRVPEEHAPAPRELDGIYARTGLCPDTELVENFPSHYLILASHQHLAACRNWEMIRWLGLTVPGARNRRQRNSLPAMARWRIVGSLRQDLLAPSMFLLLVAAWLVLPGSPLLWTALAAVILLQPAYIRLGRALTARVPGVPLIDRLRQEWRLAATGVWHAFLSASFLPHQALLMLDATIQSVTRLALARRRQIGAQPAKPASQPPPDLQAIVAKMWPASVIAVALLGVVTTVAPVNLPWAAPFLCLWCVSPLIAHRTGRQRPVATLLQADDAATLRLVARTTWRFFEELVGPSDHWLAPERYQESAGDAVVTRTSPTQIGLQLLSTLAAYDFGYLSVRELLSRIEQPVAALLVMERYRGHFYSGYDTRTLAPQQPRSVSTADSGNLAAFLLALKEGLGEAVRVSPIVDGRFLRGLDDTMAALRHETGRDSTAGSRSTGAPRAAPLREIASFRERLSSPPTSLAEWVRLLQELTDGLARIEVLLYDLQAQTGDATDEDAASAQWRFWIDRAASAIGARQTDLTALAGWTSGTSDSSTVLPEAVAVPSVAKLMSWCDAAMASLTGDRPIPAGLREALERSRNEAAELIRRAEHLIQVAEDLVTEMDFAFLFDSQRQLFSSHYSVTEGTLDFSHFDTLASDARLACFIAIVTGSVSPDLWSRLGRSTTRVGGTQVLLSWGGSMLEYLMPAVVMRAEPGTLLHETYGAAVQRQIDYATSRGVPWGISDSAFGRLVDNHHYESRQFGVPGLGLKRGLADDLVVAPYATTLAATIRPHDVAENLRRLAQEGLTGRFGLYEAIDYTPARLLEPRRGVIVRAFVAEHLSLSLIALDNCLHDAPMPRRFHADPRIQAAESLLREQTTALQRAIVLPAEPVVARTSPEPTASLAIRRYVTPHTLSPRVHLLSNGSYSAMMTSAGGGYSRRREIAMTRWREDITCDDWGTFIYLRDLETGEVWSSTHQPSGREADEYEVTFAIDRAIWRRLDAGLETRTEVIVSPEDDVEVRRVSITNHSMRPRTLDVTSYAEVVLVAPDADLASPMVSNLFVETIAVPERDALIATRRPSSGKDRVYMVHVLSGRGRVGPPAEYETDRARFVGRGRTLKAPSALAGNAPLSNTTGWVLDPIVSLRQSVQLPPGGTARLSFTTGAADSESAARSLIDKYWDRRAVARAIALASTHAQIELRHLNLTVEDAILFQRLAGRILYGDPRLRSVDAIRENRRGRPELWKHGISGDLPIVFAQIGDDSHPALYRDLLKAHEYLRLKGLLFDLVVVNEQGAASAQDLQEGLEEILDSGPEQGWRNRLGGVFLLRREVIPPEDGVLLRATARIVMNGADGALDRQLARPQVPLRVPPLRRFADRDRPVADGRAAMPEGLESFNGFGGFADDGREYVVQVHRDGGRIPPAPWVNVIAHSTFGFVASDLGPGYTWSEDSSNNRLTPWHNDPVCDVQGEAMFLRDDDTGRSWSVTPLPAGGGEAYTVRHGQGYSVYEHLRDGVHSALWLYVAPEDPVKVFQLRLWNSSPLRRSLSVTLYVEWVLGRSRVNTHLHVVTEREPTQGTLLAYNAFRETFSDRVAFVDLYVSDPGRQDSGSSTASPARAADSNRTARRTFTCDRTEFIGRNGHLSAPRALERDGLSERAGAAMDPCGAIQVDMMLDPDERKSVIGLLGEAADAGDAAALVARFRESEARSGTLDTVRASWDTILGTIQIKTPDRSFDIALNRWLLYQTLVSGIWGRSAFYQSAGAFVFRKQLQDVLALLFAAPHLVREQILRAAARQFAEGDVQQWWHEPSGEGARTRSADDRLWLVYTTLEYIAATGDTTVLDEQVPFLEGRSLRPEESAVYERPAVSHDQASVYEHCVRALGMSRVTGAHGLPLIGGGDWCESMDRIGLEGRGESVWLGWFLLSLLKPFAELAAARGDRDLADMYRRHATLLVEALEAAWDGHWYRRAYFDDGTPLGSASGTECRIDGATQSWAVMSNSADPARARQAMESVRSLLVQRNDQLVRLFTPPFDQMTPDPGSISSYPPGTRENGGQVTTAAAWTVMACARLGDGDGASELFAMLNAVNHARTPEDVHRYRVEPYAMAADIHSAETRAGRGGWTWYAGSAWMYRAGLESILGLSLHEGALAINPCIPRAWPGYEAIVRHGAAAYRITVENPEGVTGGVKRVEVDGRVLEHARVPMFDDGVTHLVSVVLGEVRSSEPASPGGKAVS